MAATMAVIMAVTIAVTIVAAHGKQSLQNLENRGRKKITGALGIGANGINIGPQCTIQKKSERKMIPQRIIPTTPNRPIKIHWI